MRVETAGVDDGAGDADAAERLADELELCSVRAGKVKGERLDRAARGVEDRFDAGSVRGINCVRRNAGEWLNPASEVLTFNT